MALLGNKKYSRDKHVSPIAQNLFSSRCCMWVNVAFSHQVAHETCGERVERVETEDDQGIGHGEPGNKACLNRHVSSVNPTKMLLFTALLCSTTRLLASPYAILREPNAERGWRVQNQGAPSIRKGSSHPGAPQNVFLVSDRSELPLLHAKTNLPVA